MSSQSYETRLNEWREQIDLCIKDELHSSIYPEEFKEILDYALFPGGKRLRPVLFLEWHSLTAPPDERALKFACAIEIMHCYSLVHDDMPCMDNDDVRRGKPSLHKKYGEGKALLAGDALLNMAYRMLAEAADTENRMVLNRLVSYFGGDGGIIHGQYLDLYGNASDINELMKMYAKKTAALISVACVTGYLFPMYSFDLNISDILNYVDTTERMGADRFADPQSAAAALFGETIKFGVSFGIAFQIYDDLSEYINGERSDGTSVIDYMDLEEAKKLLNEYLNLAISTLDNYYDADTSYIREIAKSIVIV